MKSFSKRSKLHRNARLFWVRSGSSLSPLMIGGLALSCFVLLVCFLTYQNHHHDDGQALPQGLPRSSETSASSSPSVSSATAEASSSPPSSRPIPAFLQKFRDSSKNRGWQVVANEELHEKTKERDKIRAKSVEKDYDLTTTAQKQQAVKEAFRHAFRGYIKNAWGHDEIRPTTNQTNDSWGHFGATIIDSLDTMYLMGLTEEFAQSLEFVRGLNFESDFTVSVFETTIRFLGGLLSAYDLSGEKILLQKAIELGDRLMPAYGDDHLMFSVVNLKTGEAHNYGWTGGKCILAEFGSVQLEMKHLSALSGDPKYGKVAEHVMKDVAKMQKNDGLYDVLFDPYTKQPSTGSSLVSFGGLGDSFYEYLLKQWLLSGKTEEKSMDMYLSAMEGLVNHLVFLSQPSHHTYISELRNGAPTHVMEHLACFVPGMLELGARSIPRDLEQLALSHAKLAWLLLDTCVYLGESTRTGLQPDAVRFWASEKANEDFQITNSDYILRPETVESLFYHYRFTKDESFRRHGWRIFQAIEKHCKTPAAYSGVKDVDQMPPELNNSMQSFFLAETLKYFWLLFSDDPDVVPLDRFVLTTEGHPLRIHTPEQIIWG